MGRGSVLLSGLAGGALGFAAALVTMSATAPRAVPAGRVYTEVRSTADEGALRDVVAELRVLVSMLEENRATTRAAGTRAAGVAWDVTQPEPVPAARVDRLQQFAERFRETGIRPWLFMSEADVLATFGKPDQVSGGALETWTCYVPPDDGQRTERIILTFSRGRLIQCQRL